MKLLKWKYVPDQPDYYRELLGVTEDEEYVVGHAERMGNDYLYISALDHSGEFIKIEKWIYIEDIEKLIK